MHVPAHEILRGLPPARRRAALRAAQEEVIALLESVFNAVGFPKAEGWSPVVCHDLEAVRQRILNPKELEKEV